jgi:putative hydrolase of the HAD superfamily
MHTTQIKAILFDLGNTLSRSASLSSSLADIANTQVSVKLNLSVDQLLKIGIEIEQEISRLYEVERLDQPDWKNVWWAGIENCGFDFADDAVEALCRAHLEQYLKNCEIEAYTFPLLAHLRKVKIPIGLVSNVTGPSEIFERDLSEKGLRPYFDTVVWSSRLGVRKPNPKIFQIALEGLKLEPSRWIVMVGDHEIADILGGKQMGFTTVKIVPDGDGSESAADYVVTGAELQNLLETKFIHSKAC